MLKHMLTGRKFPVTLENPHADKELVQSQLVETHLPEVMSEQVAASTERDRKKAQCQTVCLISS